MKRTDHIVEPRLAKPLLALHAAMDVEGFWQASQDLLEAAMPSLFIGCWLQLNPLTPMICLRNRLWMPDKKWFEGYFACNPVSPYLAAHPGARFVGTSHGFKPETEILKTKFYREYMKPDNWRYAMGLMFWKGVRLLGGLSICRSPEQGDFTREEMRLLRQLYPHFQIALRRVGRQEHERLVRSTFEKFFRRLPLPTLLLDWNFEVLYLNRAARESCAVWTSGADAAQQLTADFALPPEVLRECQRLQALWQNPPGPNAPPPLLRSELLHHPAQPRLTASVELVHLNAAALGKPQFVVQFEDFRDGGGARQEAERENLPHLTRLRPRERELALLVREGCSNQEIADRLGCSLPTVKKQLNAIFHKLEVPSRSRLIALLR